MCLFPVSNYCIGQRQDINVDHGESVHEKLENLLTLSAENIESSPTKSGRLSPVVSHSVLKSSPARRP